MSTANASKWVVRNPASPFANPLNGPRDGRSSRITTTSAGHHPGRDRAETATTCGRNSRSKRNCLSHKNSPPTANLALSFPIRVDSPPTNKTAVIEMLDLPSALAFVAVSPSRLAPPPYTFFWLDLP